MHILSSVTTTSVLVDNKRTLSSRTLNNASGDISDVGEVFDLVEDPANENEETDVDNTGTITNMNSLSFNGRAMIGREDSEDVMTAQYNGSVASVSPAPEDSEGNPSYEIDTSFNTPSDTRHRPLTPPTHNSYFNSGTKVNSEEPTPVQDQQAIDEAGEVKDLSTYQKKESFSKAAIRSFLFDDEDTEIVRKKTPIDHEDKSNKTSRIASPQPSLRRRSYRSVSPAPLSFAIADPVNMLLNADESEMENSKVMHQFLTLFCSINQYNFTLNFRLNPLKLPRLLHLPDHCR